MFGCVAYTSKGFADIAGGVADTSEYVASVADTLWCAGDTFGAVTDTFEGVGDTSDAVGDTSGATVSISRGVGDTSNTFRSVIDTFGGVGNTSNAFRVVGKCWRQFRGLSPRLPNLLGDRSKNAPPPPRFRLCVVSVSFFCMTPWVGVERAPNTRTWTVGRGGRDVC